MYIRMSLTINMHVLCLDHATHGEGNNKNYESHTSLPSPCVSQPNLINMQRQKFIHIYLYIPKLSLLQTTPPSRLSHRVRLITFFQLLQEHSVALLRNFPHHFLQMLINHLCSSERCLINIIVQIQHIRMVSLISHVISLCPSSLYISYRCVTFVGEN